MRPPRRPQQGFLLIAAAVLIVLAAVFAVVVAYLVASNAQSGASRLAATQALYVAESGLERGAQALLSPELAATATDPRIACGALTNDPHVTGIAFGPGVFTVSAKTGIPEYNGGTPAGYAATTLASALNATATTIPLNSVAGYAPAGRVLIDREAIDYSGTSSSAAVCGGAAYCLTGAERGRDGTQAAAHAAGTPVGQYQCDLLAQAGVSSLTSPLGARTLAQGVQLQEGWAVGRLAAGSTLPIQNLNGVDCISSTDCWAVGNQTANTTSGWTILHWDGTAWTLFPVTTPGIGAQALYAIDCTTASNCWAVGNGGTILQYTGSWSSVGNVGTANAFYGVDCIDASDCWAVGHKTGIYNWNGSTWQLVPPFNARFDNLNAVVATSTTSGWAMGNGGIVYRLTATGWAPYSSFTGQKLYALACTTATSCWATSTNQNNGGIWYWNGVFWSNAAPQGLNLVSQDLYGVAVSTATTPTSGWAVGKATATDFTFLQWNGAAWSSQPLADPAPTNLLAVTCVAVDDCWAVGDASPTAATLLHWDGTAWSPYGAGRATVIQWDNNAWTDQSAYLPPGGNELTAISMLSYADGWAVGLRAGGNATILRWNGSSAQWIVPPPPNPVVNRNLFGVDAVSANEAWAVGAPGGCGPGVGTVLHWNGSAWGCDAAGTPAVKLDGIAMLDITGSGTADDGWAVGNKGTKGTKGTLVRWGYTCAGAVNPGAWSNCTAASPTTQNLTAVQLLLSTNGLAEQGWAVGDTPNNGPWTVLSWAGGTSAWTVVPVYTTAGALETQGVSLDGLSILDVNGDGQADDGWAVGAPVGTTGQPAMLRWNNSCNGAQTNTGYWMDCSAYAPVTNQALTAVYMTTPDDGWAVDAAGELLHWDGQIWTLQTSPTTNRLNALAIIGPQDRPDAGWQEIFP